LKRATATAARATDLVSCLDQMAKLPSRRLALRPTEVVTHHDSGQGLNAVCVRDEPRRLLPDVLGCPVRELSETSVCCGFGGAFSFDFPAVAKRLLDSKFDDAEGIGAKTVVTDYQGCFLHLRAGCDAKSRRLEGLYGAEVLAEHFKCVERDSPKSGHRQAPRWNTLVDGETGVRHS